VGGDGAQVAQVLPSSPAAQAGLRQGDVVVALNGRPVRGAAELRARLSVVPVGESIDLRVQRGKESQTLKARIGELEQGQVAGGQGVPLLAGAGLAETERKGLPGRNRAVTVTALEPGSPAFAHGLRAGDLIIGVNQRRVTSVQELAKAMQASGRLVLNVIRGDIQLAIPIR
jgi:S1-C subfamily serine protease